MIVLGIDPGLNTTGYGLVRDVQGRPDLIEAGTIDGGDEHVPLEQRLARLYRSSCEILEQYQPGAVAMEALYSHYAHPATAILMAHARGVLCLAAGIHGVPRYDYAPTHIKARLTGSGRASKNQMQRVVQQLFRLPSAPDPPDVADAIAVAVCHLDVGAMYSHEVP